MKKQPDISEITVTQGIDAARAFMDSAKPYRPKPKPKAEAKPPPSPERENPAPAAEEVLPLKTVSAASWAGKTAPDRPWLVRDRLMRGAVAILNGDGGIGKTTIVLQLAVGAILDLGWLNSVIEDIDPVMFLTAEEEEEEVWRRVAEIAAHHGKTVADLADLHVFSCLTEEIDPTLGAPDNNRTIQPTRLFHQLTARALEIKPALIIIEAAADVFAGNEINRHEVRQFMGLLRKLARKTKAAVLLLQHPSQSGMKSDTGTSGSSHWNNLARPRLYFSAPGDDDVRELRVMKNNYGAKGEVVRCRWQKGVFVPLGMGSPLERAAATASVDNIFLRCLDVATAQGRTISPNKGSTYAPAVFEPMAEAANINGKPAHRRKVLGEAMERLISAEKITGKPIGSRSKPRTQLVRKGE